MLLAVCWRTHPTFPSVWVTARRERRVCGIRAVRVAADSDGWLETRLPFLFYFVSCSKNKLLRGYDWCCCNKITACDSIKRGDVVELTGNKRRQQSDWLLLLLLLLREDSGHGEAYFMKIKSETVLTSLWWQQQKEKKSIIQIHATSSHTKRIFIF